MTETPYTTRTEIARVLNRGKVSAAPLRRLALISIFDDDEYENYDFDIVPPRRRLKIGSLLTDAGYRQKTGNTFVDQHGTVAFPKPGILGSDPSRPALELLKKKDSWVVLVTPTQAILLYLHHFAGEGSAPLSSELESLVWEQPANLDKISDWSRAAGFDPIFGRLRSALEAQQAEGIDLRRRKLFRSRLPS